MPVAQQWLSSSHCWWAAYAVAWGILIMFVGTDTLPHKRWISIFQYGFPNGGPHITFAHAMLYLEPHTMSRSQKKHSGQQENNWNRRKTSEQRCAYWVFVRRRRAGPAGTLQDGACNIASLWGPRRDLSTNPAFIIITVSAHQQKAYKRHRLSPITYQRIDSSLQLAYGVIFFGNYTMKPLDLPGTHEHKSVICGGDCVGHVYVRAALILTSTCRS